MKLSARQTAAVIGTAGIIAFGCSAPCEICVEHLEGFLAWHFGGRRVRVGEVHCLRLIVAEGRPFREPFAVRITIFREVNPILAHKFRERTVNIRTLKLIHVLEDEIHVLAVVGTLSEVRRTFWMVRMLVEIIQEYL